MKKRLVTAMLALAPLFSSAPAADGALGDRLVMSINNVPYTQRQVEIYISVKESLRKTDPKSPQVRLVEARNWGDALQVFGEDMIILQEAQRLGSFQSTEGGGQALQRYDALVRDRIAKHRELRDTLLRLGADQHAVARALESVLRVAAFRRSKDRQAQLGSGGVTAAKVEGEGEGEDDSGRRVARWLVDLTDRAVVRRYEGAADWVLIQPTMGKGVDGL